MSFLASLSTITFSPIGDLELAGSVVRGVSRLAGVQIQFHQSKPPIRRYLVTPPPTPPPPPPKQNKNKQMAGAQKTGTKTEPLVSGNMDQNLRNPSYLILSHTQIAKIQSRWSHGIQGPWWLARSSLPGHLSAKISTGPAGFGELGLSPCPPQTKRRGSTFSGWFNMSGSKSLS